MNNARTFHRWGKRFAVRVGIVLVLLAGFVCLLRFILPKPATTGRITIVIAGSPVSVWSWDTVGHTITVVSIPSEYVVDAVNGYGHYSLEALWKLGVMDKRDGLLLADSIGDSLGISIPWYIGEKTEGIPAETDVVAFGKQLFSFSRMPKLIAQSYRTNISLPLFFSITKELSGLRIDKIVFIDLSQKSISLEEELPDGTKRHVISPADIDTVLKGVFEDERIRQEGYSVALYNTTHMPSLANRAARILSTLGMLVVSVGNQEEEVTRCEMLADAAAIQSFTGQAITAIFHCEGKPPRSDKRADIEVFIGSDYASRFEPGNAGH
jgi:hypothetical protein